MSDPKSQITQILEEIGDGRQSAEELLPLVYDELRSLARVRMARWLQVELAEGRVRVEPRRGGDV